MGGINVYPGNHKDHNSPRGVQSDATFGRKEGKP